MAKKKSKYETWDEVTVALRDMRDIALRRRRAEIEMNNAITTIKDKFYQTDKPEKQAYDEIATNVKLYVEAHREEFTDKKSRNLTFGTVGFRRATEIVTRNVKAIIAAAKHYAMDDCIDVTEKLNKTAMAKYDDNALEKIGAHRQEKDIYFCELDIDELEG